MPSLIIVRHGQSEYNLQNRFTGELDVSLTDYGRAEALHAAEKIEASHIAISCAFVSNLQRAQETLAIILKQLRLENKIPVWRSQALNERNYGELQGLDKKETADRYSAEQVYQWRRGYFARPPGGESLEDTYARVIRYYNENIVPVLNNNQNVLIVAHGNSLRALMMYLEKMSPEEVEHLEIATGLPKLYELNNANAVVEVRML